MSVIVQPTPNPNAMKFVLSSIRFAQPLSFASVEAAATHPLAAQLFAVGGIYNVFMAQDFVTVNKLPEIDWASLVRQLQPVVEQFDQDSRRLSLSKPASINSAGVSPIDAK